MEQEIKQQIQIAANKLKLNPNVSFFDTQILELIASIQGKERLTEILSDDKILVRLSGNHVYCIPVHVLNFIFEIIKSTDANSHLDPCANISSPVIQKQFKNSKAICRVQSEVELIKEIFPENKTEIILGNSLDELEKLNQKFDIITSFPPFGMRQEPITINGQKSPRDFGASVLLKSSTLLNENGIGIFLMPLSFLIDKSIRETAKSLGLHVQAVFSIPAGAFLPYTNIAANLILFSNKPKEKLFVAELSTNESTNKTIFENYRNGKEGKVIQLGTLVNSNDFVSLSKLIAEKEMQEMVKRFGFPPIALTEISSSITILKGDNPDEVNHLPNSIYLPKIGISQVVTNPDAMKIKPKNYFQIQLNSEIANATYVSNYFNSPVGKKQRESLNVGAVIPQISKSNLSSCIIFLPDMVHQLKLIELDGKIEQFNLRLDELKRNLWKHPKSYKEIQKELTGINQDEKLEHWIDKLPFPISSILWRYYATNDYHKKVEHLLHFFEALSEFFAMIMLSAFVHDKEFYKEQSHKWIDTNEKFKEWYLKATFGSWNYLTARLSKATREFLSGSESKEHCKSLYGNPSDAFLNMITSKGIINVLNEVVELRNKWKGHGGISSEEENKARVITLEQQLNEIRKYIADGFEETRMLSPTSNIYEDGIYNYNAKELIGARTPFNEISLKSLIPLDRKKLYLSHYNQSKPLELLPFIKFIVTSDACYFYTSIESKNVRWVSYHHDKDPELNQPADQELFNAFEFLKPS